MEKINKMTNLLFDKFNILIKGKYIQTNKLTQQFLKINAMYLISIKIFSFGIKINIIYSYKLVTYAQ